MAHDPDLAERIRALLAAEAGVSEQRMFGGVSFLVDGPLTPHNQTIGGSAHGAADDLLAGRALTALSPIARL